MNKKGIFIPTLVILTLVVSTYAILVFIIQNPSGELEAQVGGYAINLSNKFYEGEAAEFLIRDAAKISSHNSLVNISKNGGFSKQVFQNNDCERKDSYVIWKENCNPNLDSLKESYISTFNKILNGYLINNGFGNLYDLDLEFGDKNFSISLIARKNLVFKDEVIEYRLNTSFKNEVNYDLAQYSEINDLVISKRSCFLEGEEPSECIGDEPWKIVKDGNVFKFDIESEESYLVEENGEIKFAKVVIKFAKDFSDVPSFT